MHHTYIFCNGCKEVITGLGVVPIGNTLAGGTKHMNLGGLSTLEVLNDAEQLA